MEAVPHTKGCLRLLLAHTAPGRVPWCLVSPFSPGISQECQTCWEYHSELILVRDNKIGHFYISVHTPGPRCQLNRTPTRTEGWGLRRVPGADATRDGRGAGSSAPGKSAAVERHLSPLPAARHPAPRSHSLPVIHKTWGLLLIFLIFIISSGGGVKRKTVSSEC